MNDKQEDMYSNYITTRDGKKIFFSTNFPHNSDRQGKPVVMFNYGLVCSNQHWGKQIQYFKDIGYDVIIHNYRGHFNSTGEDDVDSITFENIAEDINLIIERLELSDVTMLGHSMGVNVTLEYSKLYQEKLNAMILISGSVLSPRDTMFKSNILDITGDYWVQMKDSFPEFYNFFWRNSGKIPVFRDFVRQGGFNKEMVPQEYVNQYLNLMGQLNPEIFFKLIDQMHAHDMISHVERIQTPTLLVGGDQDQMIPNYALNVLLEKLPNAKMYIVKDGSHVPQIDFPKFINQRIKVFLDTLTNNYKEGKKAALSLLSNA
ncbi:MAG: alpha/beta hydrolase [Bacteriovoracaceae bacterium]|jgi:non-heme chloroperoxidase|nr:alpha/beta hydrolase [Bacteriovoracaceae bacterium]